MRSIKVTKLRESMYQVRSASGDEFDAGSIRIRTNDNRVKELTENRRRVIRLTNERSKRSIYCEAIYADQSFVEKYNLRLKERNKVLEPEERPHVCVREKRSDLEYPIVFIGGWYRGYLGLENPPRTGKLITRLTITADQPQWYGLWRLHAQLQACLQHPQIVVSLATVMAIIGAGLGVIGAGLGIAAVKDFPGLRDAFKTASGESDLGVLAPVIVLFCLVGLAILVYGIVGFARRTNTLR